MKTIILATHNVGKIREIQPNFETMGIEILPQSHFKIPEVAETGLTFVENAILKARNASLYSGLPAIADDSGLQVEKLHGAPGIYSSRYAGKNASDQENLEKLLYELKTVPDAQRSARFVCVIVFLKEANDPTPLFFQGTWNGKILFSPRGNKGFGYDPIFYVPEYNCSAAELNPEIKNQISHRGQALQQLIQHFRMTTIS